MLAHLLLTVPVDAYYFPIVNSTLYTAQECISVNEARLQIFQKNVSTKSATEIFSKKVCNFDSSLIPPFWKSLNYKMLRTIYVTAMWQNTTDHFLYEYSFEEHV